MYTGEKFTCEDCGIPLIDEASYKRHKQLTHPSTKDIDKVPCKCYNCNNEFQSAEELNIHQNECLKENENKHSFTCHLCKQPGWKSSDVLRKHIAECHRKVMSVCDQCGKALNSNNAIRSHVARVHLNKKLSCPHCEKKFNIKSTLSNHIFKEHPSVSVTHYKCEHCEKAFKLREQLKEHVNAVHTKEILYRCEYCDFTTYRRKNLYNHVKVVHEKYKPNKCDYCPKQFHYKRDLANHIAKHHDML